MTFYENLYLQIRFIDNDNNDDGNDGNDGEFTKFRRDLLGKHEWISSFTRSIQKELRKSWNIAMLRCSSGLRIKM